MNYKLGFLCGSHSWGGLEMNQLKNAIWFAERGHTCVILCKEGSPIEVQAKEKGIQVIAIPPHRRYKYFFSGLKFAKILAVNQITHVITRDSKDLNICSIAKTFSKQKFQLSYFMEMQIGVSKRNFLHTARYKKIDVWVCPLNYLKEQVLTYTKFPEYKIKVIPSAIEIKENQFSQEELRELLHIPKSAFVLGIVGRIDQHKGQLEVVKAIHRINNPDIVLCIIGSPTMNESTEYFEEIQHYIKENKIENSIFLVPYQENASDFYVAFDATIMSSKSETFGMVSIESLANGVPVIGTNSGGTPELLENGKYGLLYDFGDQEKLMKHILSLYYQEVTFSSSDLKNYSEKFSHQLILQQVEKLFIRDASLIS